MSPLLLTALLVLSAPAQEGKSKITQQLRLEAADGVTVVADLYRQSPPVPDAPLLVLFHRSRSSRGEYRDIAPRLLRMGYDSLAVDLRSGGKAGGVRNLTNLSAFNKQAPSTYLDTLVDMVTALEHARLELTGGPVVAWGSGYSAGLVLHLAGSRPDLVEAVVAFGPNECFTSLGKSETWVRESAALVRVPTFVTGGRSAEKEWGPLVEAVPAEVKVGFVPQTEGRSSSRALAREYEDGKEYWEALSAFLEANVPPPAAAQEQDEDEPDEDG